MKTTGKFDLPDNSAVPYVPSAHPKAETLLRAVARQHGYKLSFNSRGDWLVYEGRKFRGVIVNITSDFSAPAPSPIASRPVIRGELEELRGAMNDALITANILEAA